MRDHEALLARSGGSEDHEAETAVWRVEELHTPADVRGFFRQKP